MHFTRVYDGHGAACDQTIRLSRVKRRLLKRRVDGVSHITNRSLEVALFHIHQQVLRK